MSDLDKLKGKTILEAKKENDELKIMFTDGTKLIISEPMIARNIFDYYLQE